MKNDNIEQTKDVKYLQDYLCKARNGVMTRSYCTMPAHATGLNIGTHIHTWTPVKKGAAERINPGSDGSSRNHTYTGKKISLHALAET